MGYPLLAVTVALALTRFWWLAFGPGVVLALVVYFFRSPPGPFRRNLVCSWRTCDGTVAEVSRIEHDEYIGGPAVRIGIFLSIFNVHINRCPARAGRSSFAMLRANSSMR